MCLHFIVALVKFPPLSPGCDRSAPICPPLGGASVVAPLGLYLTFAARASTTAALRASCKKRSFFLKKCGCINKFFGNNYIVKYISVMVGFLNAGPVKRGFCGE